MKQILLFLGLSFILASCTLTQDKTQGTSSNTDSSTQASSTDAQAKFDQVQKEVEAMKQDGMNSVKVLYPDLQLVKSVKRGDAEQLAMMGDEEWMYSATYDTTIVVCKDMNTPAHVFRGKTLSAEEFAKVRKMHEDMMKMMEGTGMMQHSTGMMDGAMMKKDEGTMVKEDAMMKKETGYQVYSPELVANALKSGQKVALFFHATWCPSCKSLNSTLESNLSTIPSDSLIVKVDYDQYTELKKQYRVVSQHTTVQLNADGTEKSKKLGARTVADVLQ